MKRFIFAVLITAAANSHSAQSIAVYNVNQESWTHSSNINQTRSLASLTKLMTVMVSLDHSPDLTEKIALNTASPRLPKGSYSKLMLITAVLVRSDNSAAEALAQAYPGGRKQFIQQMNSRAKALGMLSTRFVDASGLSTANISTAIDVVTMVRAADSYAVIREISVKKQADLEVGRKQQLRTLLIHNTNQQILIEFEGITVSKTGFTGAAGWCVAMMITKGRTQSVVVVMGAATPKQRHADVNKIMLNYIADTEPAQEQQQITAGDWIRSWLGLGP